MAAGGFFIFLGIMFFFDAGLIAIGNILLLSGVFLFQGVQSAIQLFTRRIPGTVVFSLGFILVFLKWPLFGLIIEMFGFINLFGDFLPLAIRFSRQLPGIGTVMNLPGLSRVFDYLSNQPSPV